MKPTLDCRTVSRLLSEGLDENLPAADRARLRLHFIVCEGCRNVRDQFAFLRKAIRALGSGTADGEGSPPDRDTPARGEPPTG